MNKLTIGLITAGMINCLIIGWAVSSKIEVKEWRTHNENLVHILNYLHEIREGQKSENARLNWYMDIIEKIERNTKPKEGTGESQQSRDTVDGLGYPGLSVPKEVEKWSNQDYINDEKRWDAIAKDKRKP